MMAIHDKGLIVQTYIFQCQTTTGGLPWQHQTEMASDEMALEYGARLAKDFIGARWFMSLLVFSADKLIGTIVINEPSTSIKYRG